MIISPVYTTKYDTGNISFSSLQREVYTGGNKLKYRNNTDMFRCDLRWDSVVDEITKNPIPPKIYCYACSDGSEPYSIAIALISKLGWEKAQKYFPIIARDIDESMIERAKSGVLALSDWDLDRIEKYKKCSATKFFSSIEKISDENSGDFIYKGVVSDKLKRCVDFQVSDFCKDAEDMDYNNSVIFFRNVWPYLSRDKRKKLVSVISKKLNATTAIVTGNFDTGVFPYYKISNSSYGLLAVTKNYFKGTRHEDIPRVKLPSFNDESWKYRTNINSYNYVKSYNKQIISSMINKFNKNANNKKIRKREEY